jgi:hypothetical protein|tara:strand:- start:2143 stop:2442 length:300 start_codon:yes stop_codon:yes gene_type:complete
MSKLTLAQKAFKAALTFADKIRSVKKIPKQGSLKHQENAERRAIIKKENQFQNIKPKVKSGLMTMQEAAEQARISQTVGRVVSKSIKSKFNRRSKVKDK